VSSATGRLNRLVAARRSARAVGLFRIGVGGAALIRGLKSARDLWWLRGEGFIPAPPFDWSPAIDSPARIAAFLAIWVLLCVGLIVGYRGRLCAFLLACGMLLQHLVDQNLWANHQYLLGLFLLLLSLTENDAAFSLRWIREDRPDRAVVRWPMLLVQLQLSIVYFYTAVAKINPTFLGGEMLRRNTWLPDPLETPAILSAAAIATVGVEFFLAAALWIAPLRYWAFLAGFIFHALVPVTMAFIAALLAFSLMTLSVYLLFIDVPERSRLVIWDDRCAFCGWWVRHLKRLDWLRVHRFEGSMNAAALAEAGITRAQADEEIKLWDGRRVYGGIDAVREILKNLPAGFLWAQALALPGVRWVGDRAYRAVARRRMCLVSPSAAGQRTSPTAGQPSRGSSAGS
jgi:predicted DCC family thiol-disulfide oxidoreductase YuxK